MTVSDGLIPPPNHAVIFTVGKGPVKLTLMLGVAEIAGARTVERQ